MSLPKIKRVRKRTGAVYRYYRNADGTLTSLPSLPEEHPEFLRAYAAAAEAPAVPRVHANAGSIEHTGDLLLSSAVWKDWSYNTRKSRRWIIREISQSVGDVLWSGVRRRHIEADLKPHRPATRKKRLTVWRHLIRVAIENGFIETDPSADIHAKSEKTSGFHTWTEAELKRFREFHKTGTTPRLALEIMWSTGLAPVDALRVGWSDAIDEETLHLKRSKTGAEVWPVISPELRRELAHVTDREGPWLKTQYGKPFSSAGFVQRFRAWCDAAGLPQCTAHGIRKARATRMAESGKTTHQLMAAFGWVTLQEAERYTRRADRRRLAKSASLETGG